MLKGLLLHHNNLSLKTFLEIRQETGPKAEMLCWLTIGVPNPRVYTHA